VLGHHEKRLSSISEQVGFHLLKFDD